MDIIYAAEKPSIASILSDHLKKVVRPHEIEVHESPNETGRFLINWRFSRYTLSPNGDVAESVLSLASD